MGNHHGGRTETPATAQWRFHERHFSAARLGTYVNVCAGDREAAAELYRWNGEVCG